MVCCLVKGSPSASLLETHHILGAPYRPTTRPPDPPVPWTHRLYGCGSKSRVKAFFGQPVCLVRFRREFGPRSHMLQPRTLKCQYPKRGRLQNRPSSVHHTPNHLRAPAPPEHPPPLSAPPKPRPRGSRGRGRSSKSRRRFPTRTSTASSAWPSTVWRRPQERPAASGSAGRERAGSERKGRERSEGQLGGGGGKTQRCFLGRSLWQAQEIQRAHRFLEFWGLSGICLCIYGKLTRFAGTTSG